MKLFGKEFGVKKKDYKPVSEYGWQTLFGIPEWFFQQDVKISHDTALACSAVYSCVTLIASDIGKLPLNLVQSDANDIWNKIDYTLAPSLEKPNIYQNRIKFIEQWVISKLTRGNTYVLKDRNREGKVTALYVLDPRRVKLIVTDVGDVFYEIQTDNLAGVDRQITVPSSEIIHDMMPGLFHPLCGTPPLFACGLSALQALNIQKNSAKFFGNMSRPSGMLTAPGAINTETATRLKAEFEKNFSGQNIGKLAVAGDGLEYKTLTIDAVDAQLIEQLKWTAQDICSCFHVPSYKVGFSSAPTYANAEIMNQIYYSDCLQSLIENIELCLEEGLGLDEVKGKNVGVQFDLDALLRMDTKSRYDSYGSAISKGWFSPNEARAKENMQPVDGGNTPYLQVQNSSLAALARRDSQPLPSKTTAPAVGDNQAAAKHAEDYNKKMIEHLKASLA